MGYDLKIKPFILQAMTTSEFQIFGPILEEKTKGYKRILDRIFINSGYKNTFSKIPCHDNLDYLNDENVYTLNIDSLKNFSFSVLF